MKSFELVFICNNGTTEHYWYNNIFEAKSHANMFTDADDGELYNRLEIRHWRGDYFVIMWTGTPWQN